MLRRSSLVFLLACLAGAANAGTLVTIAADPAQSSAAFAGPPPDTRTLSGALTLELGALPPLAATTTFDLRALTLLASGPGGFSIGLDPDLANPGAGVLNAAGQFLFPTLFLQLDDGLTLSDFSLANVTGTFLPFGPGCAYTYCLETSFEIEGGEPFGLISVELVAIPEPSTALLVAAGLGSLAAVRRRRPAR